MKKRFAALLCLIALFGLFSVGCGTGDTGTHDLRVTFLETGKSDCILLETGETVTVIDTAYAENAPFVKSTLDGRGITKIDNLVITHYDEDHVGGAADLLRAYPVGRVYLPDDKTESVEVRAMNAAIAERGVATLTVREDVVLNLSDKVSARINPTTMRGISDENNRSLITEVTAEGFGLLLLGDAMKDRVTEYLNGNVGKFDVVKLPHHGDYFKALETCMIRVGAKDAVMHVGPEREVEDKVTEMCEDMGVNLYRTDRGNITLLFDAGKGYTITQ